MKILFLYSNINNDIKEFNILFKPYIKDYLHFVPNTSLKYNIILLEKYGIIIYELYNKTLNEINHYFYELDVSIEFFLNNKNSSITKWMIKN